MEGKMLGQVHEQVPLSSFSDGENHQLQGLKCSICKMGSMAFPFPPVWEGCAEPGISSSQASTLIAPSFWNVLDLEDPAQCYS